jgi:hypothetical protein
MLVNVGLSIFAIGMVCLALESFDVAVVFFGLAVWCFA